MSDNRKPYKNQYKKLIEVQSSITNHCSVIQWTPILELCDTVDTCTRVMWYSGHLYWVMWYSGHLY